MNYKDYLYDETESRFEREKKHKYNKKHNHTRGYESYSRKGKNKFNINNIDY